MERKQKKIHENAACRDKERNKESYYDRIRGIRSFGSRKMNSEAEISGMTREFSV